MEGPAIPGSGDEGDEGMTLVEMLVAIFIFTILSVTVLSIAITLLQTASGANQRFENVGDAQPLLEVMTKDLRAATSVGGVTVVSAQPDSIQFYAALGAAGGPSEVTFALGLCPRSTSAYCFTEATSPAPSYPAAAGVILSTKVLYSATAPLFTYFDGKGNPLAAGNPSSVASVAVSLVDNQSATVPTAATTFAAQVWLRNTQYSND